MEIQWVHSEDVEKYGPDALLGTANGIVVPGGFGPRGVEGMIETARYAREHRVPYLGLCLGLQVMVVEWARNILGLQDANSSEIDPATPDPVNVRLGAYGYQNEGAARHCHHRSGW